MLHFPFTHFKRRAVHDVLIDADELKSPAWQSLRPGPRALLLELRAVSDNNGQVIPSMREAARRLHVGKQAASNWYYLLRDRGWIKGKPHVGVPTLWTLKR